MNMLLSECLKREKKGVGNICMEDSVKRVYNEVQHFLYTEFFSKLI